MKIIFFGTPDFAAVSLQALITCASADVLAVYCQPDRPAGRGQSLHPGPVKTLALLHKIPILQPYAFKDPAELARLAAFKADIFVVAAYGMILPKALLDMPPLGTINVHASLLPAYRGAAPIQRAVINGEQRTGVTIMRVEPKLDSGPILLQGTADIGPDQTAGELHDELAQLGGTLLLEALAPMLEHRRPEYLTEYLKGQAQDERLVTCAPKLHKSDGVLNFNLRARQVHNQARGVTPWPGAQLCFTRLSSAEDQAKALPPVNALVEKGLVLEGSSAVFSGADQPGAVLPLHGDILPVACAEGFYGISRLKPAGGKSMGAAAFANGYLKNCTARISPV
ncbi:MAG: methionyl-tRNA formyltransferase [Deltaproteobacteria bacterium]|jgi:methionyl-tRNA formyltransferase|nr:methionyl-tRNA formyltransferase [Deltaproteobacteria bacterium]